jgi:hypothetical protein
MDYFYVVVLSIAVVLLILILTFIGLAFRSSKNSATWPPVAGSCPDYWDVDPTNQNYCIIPKWNSTSTTPPRNVGTIYKSDKTIDPKFNPPGYDSNNRYNIEPQTTAIPNFYLLIIMFGTGITIVDELH